MSEVSVRGPRGPGMGSAVWLVAILMAVPVTLPASAPATAGRSVDRLGAPAMLRLPSSGTCTDTARALLHACRNEVKDDLWEAIAVCLNVSDDEQNAECMTEADDERKEAFQECGEQFHARRELCDLLGEDPYEPDFDPRNFDDDFTRLTRPNVHFPLAIGNTWHYAGGDETVTVQVLPTTKRIEGVTCIVVNDVVKKDGAIIEDTDDWIAQAKDGSVHYCGELARDFEYFEGDDPGEAELVEIEGSFKAGRDGARSGVLMLAMPQVGVAYRQEWAVGDAEDAAQVLSTTYSFGADPDLDRFVPQALAELLCHDDCVVTRDFTPLEPGTEERKYYAPGVGLFLEVDVESGDTLELENCNFAAVCGLLP